MRRILVNYAEARKAEKRGGGFRIPIDDQLELMERGQLEIQLLDGTKPSGGDRRTPGADRGIAIFLRAECRRNGCGPGHFFGNGQA